MNEPVRSRAQWLVVAFASLAMIGCTVTQPLAVSGSGLAGELRRGDRVEIVTSDGRRLQFAVEGVDAQGVRGGGQSVSYADIRSISRKQTSMGRTALLVLGIAAAGAALAGGGGSGGGGGY